VGKKYLIPMLIQRYKKGWGEAVRLGLGAQKKNWKKGKKKGQHVVLGEKGKGRGVVLFGPEGRGQKKKRREQKKEKKIKKPRKV